MRRPHFVASFWSRSTAGNGDQTQPSALQAVAGSPKGKVRVLLLSGRTAEANAEGGNNVEFWRELGGDLAAQGYPEPAIHCRRRAAELAPDNLQLRKELVREFLLAGRTVDAYGADGGLGQVWRELGGELLGNRELMLLCRGRAVELAPENLQVRKELVRELLLVGRTADAHKSDGGLAQVWRELGGELPDQQELVLLCRSRAVDLAPDDIQVRKELVRDLLLADQVERARASDAGLAQLWRELGGEFIVEGKIELGLNCRRWAVEAAPADTQLRLELVKALLDADPANLKELASPQDASALCILAVEPIKNGDIDTAGAYLARALELDKDHHSVQEGYLRFLLATNRPQEALQIGELIDARKIFKTYERRYYKDFTAREKTTLVEASQITLASPEAIVELIRAVDYLLENKIPGAFIECGVFQGGNAVVMMRTLLYAGVTDRDIYLYDTFEGFPKPEEIDYEYFVGPALETWQRFKNREDQSDDNSDWLRYPIEQVRERIQALGYPMERVRLIKGLVENTIPEQAPDTIALLRLDTDFYRSTKHELVELFPRLQRGGILIIDDYGALHGARVATDEYMAENNIKFFPARIDEHVRIGVKL